MPIGVIINSLSIILGGLFGTFLGQHLKEDIKQNLTMVFGLSSLAMGISALGLVANISALILALVLGTMLGLGLGLGAKVERAAKWLQAKTISVFPLPKNSLSTEEYMTSFVTVLVLFCASGTGIYGSLDSGMTGDISTLLSKSILDFFTAAIFASQLGYLVSMVALPQFLIFSSLYYLAGVILPLTTDVMIQDFRACGGLLMLATGFRILKLKLFPTVEMSLAMILVFPISWAWVEWVLPLIS